jgi:NAD(P)-dependent dehydrogenase (short-subunit alcohol dehydrogenase family)
MALHRAGFDVIAGARSFASCELPGGDGIYRLPLDVTDMESISHFVQNSLHIFSTVDALVNCAGILVLGSCEETSADEFLGVMKTNFFGTAAMVKAVLPHMRKQRSGKIINFSSVLGLLGIPFQSAYTASKHAIEGYTECLAMEVAPFGIQVCLVEPGDHRGGSSAYRRWAQAMSADSPYHINFRKGIAAIAHDEENGSDPDMLGNRVAKLLQRRRMPLRERVAKFDQHLAVFLHSFIPARIMQFILTQYYLGKGETVHEEKKESNTGAQ